MKYLYEEVAYLKGLDNLVVIADESHLYSTSAVAFHAALEELNPAASIGLTASVLPGDHVIHSYKLYEAIRDKYVKEGPYWSILKSNKGSTKRKFQCNVSTNLVLKVFTLTHTNQPNEFNNV